MAHPLHHAMSSKRKWGGKLSDYQPIHDWFDASKSHFADFRHRALRHHSEGIFAAEREFGTAITISTDPPRQVPVRLIGEQHVTEDLGRIPTLADWLRCIKPESWMSPNVRIRMKEALGEDVYVKPELTGVAALLADPANEPLVREALRK
jgi:hypothetical protein